MKDKIKKLALNTLAIIAAGVIFGLSIIGGLVLGFWIAFQVATH